MFGHGHDMNTWHEGVLLLFWTHDVTHRLTKEPFTHSWTNIHSFKLLDILNLCNVLSPATWWHNVMCNVIICSRPELLWKTLQPEHRHGWFHFYNNVLKTCLKLEVHLKGLKCALGQRSDLGLLAEKIKIEYWVLKTIAVIQLLSEPKVYWSEKKFRLSHPVPAAYM